MVTGVLQGCLLGMAITFEVRKWRKKTRAEGEMDESADGHPGPEDGNEDDERTSLLTNER